MSNTHTKVALGVVVLAGFALVACTSGVGTPVDIGQAYGDSPGAFGANDRPGVTNQDNANAPAGGKGQGEGDDDVRPGSSGASGNPSSSGQTGGDGCPPCDGTVSCELTVGGQTQRGALPLQTKNGSCVSSSDGQDIVFACGGQITQNGQSVGTWKNCTKAPTSSTGGTSGDAPPPDAGTKG